MKTLFLNLMVLCCTQIVFSQKYLNITNGAVSIEIKVQAGEVGKLYYVIYKTDPIILPTAADIKILAGNAILTNVERKSVVNISTQLIDDTLTQSIINIPAVTNSTPKTFFVYTVFESATGVLGTLNKKVLTFVRKQPAYTFQSTTLSATGLTTVNFLVYLPENYYHDVRNKKYPMIVFFHGDGQKGDNVDQVRTDALPNYLDGTQSTEFIVVSPQQNGWRQTWTTPSFVEELITLMKERYRVDSEKIYGIGCSGGGGGLYLYANAYPNTFSGMSPMSGVNSLNTTEQYCSIKNIPFWGYHSDGDNTVNLNNLNVVMNSIQTCGPIIPMRKTVYKGNIHDCWKYPLKQDSLYRFFLAKTRAAKTNSVTPIDFDTIITVGKDQAGRSLLDFKTLVNNSGYKYSWYQKGGSDVAIINTETRTPSLVNANIGTYRFRLLLTKSDGNMNYRDVVVNVTNTLVTDLKDIDLTIPYSNWLIYDINGKVIREGRDSAVDLERLDAGMYVVRNEDGQYKVVIK